MKKIRDFRIELSDKKISKRIDDSVGSPENLPSIIKDIKKLLHPSTVYETFNIKDIKKIISTEELKDAISVTIIAVTIGEEIFKKIETEEDPARKAILEAIADESVDESANFVTRLISEEAKEDECSVTKKIKIDEYKKILGDKKFSKLDISKINLKLKNDILHPPKSSLFLVGRLPYSKKKNY